jgi:hypothetical protein
VGEAEPAPERHTFEQLGERRGTVSEGEREHSGHVMRHQRAGQLAVLEPPRSHRLDVAADALLVQAGMGVGETVDVAKPHRDRGGPGIQR